MNRLRCTLLVVLSVIAVQIPTCTHASWDERLNTVHFNAVCSDYGTPVRNTSRYFLDGSMWRPPTKYEVEEGSDVVKFTNRRYSANNSARLQDNAFDNNYDYSGDADPKAVIAGMYAKANSLALKCKWSQARLTYLRIVGLTRKWTGDLRDKVDILDLTIARKRLTPAEQSAVKLYLASIEQHSTGSWQAANSLLSRLNGSAGGAFLKDRIRYQYACIAYEHEDAEHAVTAFRQFIDSFPHSPRREDALIMVARICILQQAPDKQAIDTGLKAINQLLASSPHTRFYRAAFGLQGRVHFLRRQFSDALWCYYQLGDLDSARMVCEAVPQATSSPSMVRLLEAYLRRIDAAESSDDYDNGETLREINHLRNRMSLDMIRQFQNDLKNAPPLLVSYIYYRLYYTNTRLQDLANLADLAHAMFKRSPHTVMNPAVDVRLAEVEYQLRRYPQCIEWASRSLRANHLINQQNVSDRALFIRAAGESKSNRLQAAQRDLLEVLRASNDHPVRQGARELLALTCERSGNLGLALDQYFELRYDLDIDYLLDVRMSTKQIEAYLPRCKHATITCIIEADRNGASKSKTITYTRTQLLEYTLGIHYLREERWSDASKWLLMDPKRLRRTFDTGRREYGSSPSPDALTAVTDLSRLQAAVHHAHGYEAKAAAAYRYASYYHTHGDLLLYNAMLWNGDRVYAFEILWNSGIQTDLDTEAMKNYFAGHEVDLRCRELCLAVVKQYPRSKVAPQALYRAACASHDVEALAWWFEHSNKGFRYKPSGEPEALMLRLVNRYPHSPLVPNARKYAQVFAAASRPANWPHYAAVSITRSQRRDGGNQQDDTADSDAENLLVATH